MADFPAECLEDIFRHLGGAELLKCTLVCPQWNNFVGLTRSCMYKIKLRLHFASLKEGMREILRDSDRKYECIKLSDVDIKDAIGLLAIKRRRWTRVQCGDFFRDDSYKIFWHFSRILEPSIESLSLDWFSDESNHKAFKYPELNFP